MPRPSVSSVPVPAGGLAVNVLPRVDFADAYAIDLPPAIVARALAEAVFGSVPPWVGALMAIRHAVVAPLGLVAPRRSIEGAARRANRTGDRVGVFPVLAEAPDELLLGLDDRHLDFRVSVRILEDLGHRRGVVSTFVRIHNALGRAYFGVVKPFHRIVVPAMMRRAGRSVATGELRSGVGSA
ncbi:MAG TPA: DUF2867 domain-containing protein [Anaeromyxobacter sp.]|nr:DUF2867 domain-containing protein [Anaeromyxobacter sp.]